MNFIIELLVNAGVLFLLSSIIPGIYVKNYGTAIGVCLVVGLLNATLGILIRFPLNLITLFLITFIIRLVVTTIIIKLTDKFFSGFEVRSWTSAFIMAVCMSLIAAAIDKVL